MSKIFKLKSFMNFRALRYEFFISGLLLVIKDSLFLSITLCVITTAISSPVLLSLTALSAETISTFSLLVDDKDLLLASVISFLLSVRTISSKPIKNSWKLQPNSLNTFIEYTALSKLLLSFSSSDKRYCCTIFFNSSLVFALSPLTMDSAWNGYTATLEQWDVWNGTISKGLCVECCGFKDRVFTISDASLSKFRCCDGTSIRCDGTSSEVDSNGLGGDSSGSGEDSTTFLFRLSLTASFSVVWTVFEISTIGPNFSTCSIFFFLGAGCTCFEGNHGWSTSCLSKLIAWLRLKLTGDFVSGSDMLPTKGVLAEVFFMMMLKPILRFFKMLSNLENRFLRIKAPSTRSCPDGLNCNSMISRFSLMVSSWSFCADVFFSLSSATISSLISSKWATRPSWL